MKKIVVLMLCLTLMFSFVACKEEAATPVEPATVNGIINGGSGAEMSTDEEGNSIVNNLSDGDYVEWIITIDKDSIYNIEVDYACESEEFILNTELYSEDGKLQSETKFELEGTGAAGTFKTAKKEAGELKAGAYTLILRPSNMETKAINIKSIKLLP